MLFVGLKLATSSPPPASYFVPDGSLPKLPPHVLPVRVGVSGKVHYPGRIDAVAKIRHHFRIVRGIGPGEVPAVRIRVPRGLQTGVYPRTRRRVRIGDRGIIRSQAAVHGGGVDVVAVKLRYRIVVECAVLPNPTRHTPARLQRPTKGFSPVVSSNS